MIDLRTLGLYIITDRRQTGNRSLETIIEQALTAGARFFQLREKDLSVKELCLLGERILSIVRPGGGLLLINDRVDVALGLGADGVHLPQRGLRAHQARKLLGPNKLIGVSTHSLEEARQAEADGADFITFGPVFYTPSKAQYGRPVGLDALKQVSRSISIPVFALGGVKAENAPSCLEAGACGWAVISAVLAAPKVAEAVRTFKSLLP